MASRIRRLQPLSKLAVVIAVLVTSLFTAVAPARAAGEPGTTPSPDGRPLLGAQLDWATDSASGYAQRLGISAALYGRSVPLPMNEAEQGYLRDYFAQVAAQGAHALITVRPQVALSEVDDAGALALAQQIADSAKGYQGTVFVRFAPEMNAPWVPWGQQPEAYRAAFRVVAAAVQGKLIDPVVVWSPAAAEDYPFRDPSTAAPLGGTLGALDTDGNGVWNAQDDPYAPYYPGDDAVDWVGLSAYHDRTAGPDGSTMQNALPGPGAFEALLGPVQSTGPPTSASFYAAYASARHKPLLVETAAFYSPGIQGSAEKDIKTSWASQVLGAPASGYAWMGAVVWTETVEQRNDSSVSVDWRTTAEPDLATAFASLLRGSHVVTGPVVEKATLSSAVPPAAGVVLSGSVGWTAAAMALLLVLFLCLVPSWRPVRHWAYAAPAGRDERIDMLRGMAIVFVVVNHLGLTSLFQLLTQETVGVVSGAEVFVLLSGAVLGLVYGPKVNEAFPNVVGRTRKRAWKLYVTALAVVLLILILSRLPFLDAAAVTTFTDQGTGARGVAGAGSVYDLYAGMEGLFQFPVPGQLIPALLLLQVGPWQFNIMGLYVILLALSPLVLLALSRGLGWLVLLVSLGLYTLGTTTHLRVLPSQFEDSFPLLIWQVLFVLGMTAGYYRRQIVDWFSQPGQRPVLFCCVFLTAALALFSWTSPYLSNAYDIRLGLMPDETFRAVYDNFFGRTYLKPGRLINVLLLVISGYALLTAYWKPLSRALGWLLIPLGRATLYVFILHVFLILAAANIPSLQQGNLWLNTGAYLVVLGLLWAMVKSRFLFRIIPR